MMKVLLAFLVCGFIGVSYQMNFEKALTDFEDVVDKEAKECYAEFHLDRQQLDRLLKMEVIPNDRNLKCYMACLYSHLDIVDESFTVLRENAKKYFEVDEASANAIFDKCKNLKGADNCEKAYSSSNCVRDIIKGL
ncbi:hypothetical protein FQA39_LY03440 [Lamprigera yunnana]|nr:hypothetical protein FQA39_LY03440 [Lamprigera yunnana]